MDPTEVAQPGTIETAYAVLAAAVALVTGVGGTILALLKLGMPGSEKKPKGITALPALEGWEELRKNVQALTRGQTDHERLVNELHSALLDPEREVQRRLQQQQLDRVEATQSQIRSDVEAISRGTTNNAEAVEVMARRLKELSQ